jgi:hypothetical protein
MINLTLNRIEQYHGLIEPYTDILGFVWGFI